jgi:hypothetical protein
VRFLQAGYPDGRIRVPPDSAGPDVRQYVERKNFVLDGVAPTVKRRGPTVWRGACACACVTADRDNRRCGRGLPFSA